MQKLLLAATLLLSSGVSANPPLVGQYDSGQNNNIIQIVKTPSGYEGNLLSSDNANAPIGAKVLYDIVNIAGRFEGKLYMIKKDKSYDVVLTPLNDKLLLSVDAGLFNVEREWLRVTP